MDDLRNIEDNESTNSYALIQSQDINLANEYEDDSSIAIEDNNDGVSC